MAYTFQVLIVRKYLPDMDTLSTILRKAKLPLRLEHPWVWDNDSGWLPMHWRKTESGCEVELEKLTKKEATAAKKAGYSGFDSAVTITTRGWDSLKAGVAFAASLAVASSGCITEDEGEYINAGAAINWAKTVIADADKQQTLEVEWDKAREQAQSAGNIGDELERQLAGLSGAKVKQMHFMFDRLGIRLETGETIHGSAWRIITQDGNLYAQDRYASLRTKQIRLMAASAEPPSTEQENAQAQLDKEIESASKLDEKEAYQAQKEIESWPENIQIVSVIWDRPNRIKVAFDNVSTCLFTGGILGEITCSFPPIRYAITDNEVRLV